MDFTKLRFSGLRAVDLPFFNASPSGKYLLKAVDGLGPPEGPVIISKTRGGRGVYQGRDLQSRQIVARVGLTPDYRENVSVSDLRNELYGLLTPGYSEHIGVRLMNEFTIVAMTDGYVDKIEIVPFAKEPEVQITVSCLDTYLSHPNELTFQPSTKSSFVIPNAGNAPTGFYFELTFTENRSELIFTKPMSKKFMKFTHPFVVGDQLRVDTRPDEEAVELTRGGVKTDLIGSLSADSDWLTLHHGDNDFISNTTSFDWRFVSYRPQYWGI